ncbi:elongator complex protein 1 [Ciona intestinalis]
MKNLKLLYCDHLNIIPGANFLTVDSETNKLYLATTDTVYGYDLNTFNKVFEVDLKKENLTPEGNLEIVGLQFMSGEEKLCVSLKHGDIILLSTFDCEVECVGTLDCELDSMFWSPDQEVVLFTTNVGTAVAMTHDFDPITEIEVGMDKFGEGEFVNVGWGKKETQFQGTAGKFVPGKEKKVEGGLVVDDGKMKVVWRADGQYFAISTIENGCRKIRVWNRDCVLQYTSEILNGLENSLAWKPSGSLIASTQMKAHRHDVVFFELNGLQHGEFTLNFERNSVNILKLEWNSDSSVLMVLAESRQGLDTEATVTYLQLWSSTNYHWTLKQSICFHEKVALACWDSENMFDLHVLMQNGSYHLYKWNWVIDCSSGGGYNTSSTELVGSNGSYVAVVDGAKVKLTPFKYMNVPPPMCAYQYKFSTNVKHVAFCKSNLNSDSFITLTEDGSLFCFMKDGNCEDKDVDLELVAAGGNGFKTTIDILSLSAKFAVSQSVEHKVELSDLRHLLWVDDQTIIAASYSNTLKADAICLFTLDFETNTCMCKVVKAVSSNVVSMCSFKPGDNGVFVIAQMQDGKVFKYSLPSLNCEAFLDTQGSPVVLTTLCPYMSVCSFQHTSAADTTYALLSRSAQKQLFLNNTVISRECTSYSIHDEYILYTTSSHKIICISRNSDITQYNKPTENQLPRQISCDISRSVERGSTIVTVTPNDTKVVLQMPRGNLELIHPRPLVISVVKRAINKFQYRDAFILMRKHRINMNLLYDHSPQQFNNKVEHFIEQLDSVDYLNLFLSELKDENFTETMYSQYYPNSSKTGNVLISNSVTPSKVNSVCDKVLSVLNAAQNGKHFLSILTAHVRKIEPEIKQALSKVRDQKESSNSTLVAEGLRHLHVMVEGRVLYRESLATYDLELALMVAQVSNDDPKEYMPFLNKLKQMDPDYRNYEIDMFLKNYSRALVNIAKCPDHFNECIALVKSHSLHREALKQFGKYSPQYKEISNLYAEFLVSKSRYEEAGIILARCDSHKRAIKCFTTACSWQHALNSAAHLKYSKEEQTELAQNLSRALADKNRFLEAAHVLEHEANDVPSAIQALLKGRHWENALNVIRTRKQVDLIDTQVLPAIQDAMKENETSINTYSEQFERYFNRLMVVREIKKQKQLQAMLYGGGEGDLESDIASDFGSTVTGSSHSSASSRASGRTAKSRRKQERKRFSLREGSRYEEEGLLQALREVVTNLSALSTSVHSLLLHAALFHMDAEAESLQSLYDKTRSIASKNITNIWVLPDSSELNGTGPQSTVNSILSNRANVNNSEPGSLADLETFLPPKADLNVKFGMHIYGK